jgi:Cytochrome c554 and c-prime
MFATLLPKLARHRTRVLAWALTLGSAAAGCAPERHNLVATPSAPPAPVEMPGPAPRNREPIAALELNQSCEGCHAEIADEWTTSYHALAETDPAYQRAFAIEPLPFCRSCHAPEADPFGPVPVAAARVGVGCVTCHVVGEHILAAPNLQSARAAAPHAITRTPEFAAVAACANCHEFAFPDQFIRGSTALMQATVQEHAHSSEKNLPCASCHMPAVGEGPLQHKSHRFAGGHDEQLVKGALRVSADRTTGTAVTFTLVTEGAGHAFPTGDLFRRLEVSAEVTGSDQQVIGSARRYLARHFKTERKMSTHLRSVSSDDRPTGVPISVTLELGAVAVGAGIDWRVTYQRVEHPRSESEHDSVVEAEIEIASGVLPPASDVRETKGAQAHVHSSL